jgi:hypothetical protein
MYTARKDEDSKMIMTLLEACADAKAKDSAGKTAFDYAQDNERIIGADAYRKRNEAQY